ncbi:hypothetical protein [Methanosarcina sp. UBA5]|nr:hypothetical protein [Methanosarcina sp. UBA5]
MKEKRSKGEGKKEREKDQKSKPEGKRAELFFHSVHFSVKN